MAYVDKIVVEGTTYDLGNEKTVGQLTYDSTNDEIVSTKPIVETMSGYSFSTATKTNMTFNTTYAGASKNGNKLTLVLFQTITRTGEVDGNYTNLGTFTIPQIVANKIYPYSSNLVSKNIIWYSQTKNLPVDVNKNSSTTLTLSVYPIDTLALNSPTTIRLELTFLLSDNLAS